MFTTKKKTPATQQTDNRLKIDIRLEEGRIKLNNLLKETSQGIKDIRESTGINKDKLQ